MRRAVEKPVVFFRNTHDSIVHAIPFFVFKITLQLLSNSFSTTFHFVFKISLYIYQGDQKVTECIKMLILSACSLIRKVIRSEKLIRLVIRLKDKTLHM